MLSRTKIKSRLSNKTNPELQETIALALKNKAWHNLAKKLSSPTRSHKAINLDELNEKVKNNDTAVIAGKVLSKGELTKKVTIAALAFSQTAKEKLEKAKIPTMALKEQIEKNKEAKGVIVICQDASNTQDHSQHLEHAQEQKKKRGGS